MNITRIFFGIRNLGKNIFLGRDPLVARRTMEQWDAQFRGGKWDYLVTGITPNTRRLVEIIENIPSPRKVLDIGCGNGGLYFALKEKMVDVVYVGVDYSTEGITQARLRFPDVAFFVGDATEPDSSWGKDFNVVVFNEVLYYVPALRTIEQSLPLLSPRGHMVVSMYRSWRTILISLFLKFQKHATIEHLSPERGYPAFIIATLRQNAS